METLKQLRKQLNLTQAKCAEYLGIPLRTYQNYEKADVNMSSVKYKYLLEELMRYDYVDESHGVLNANSIRDICRPICEKYGISYCYLFGSYAKGKATEKSDVDLFVGGELAGMQFYEFVEVLREGLKKKVDVVTSGQIKDNPALLDEILKEGIKIYG